MKKKPRMYRFHKNAAEAHDRGRDLKIINVLGGHEALKHAASEGISDDQYEKLFEIYVEEMPYGTAKARTGDPTEWIQKRIEDLAYIDSHTHIPKTEGE